MQCARIGRAIEMNSTHLPTFEIRFFGVLVHKFPLYNINFNGPLDLTACNMGDEQIQVLSLIFFNYLYGSSLFVSWGLSEPLNSFGQFEMMYFGNEQVVMLNFS